MKFIDVCAGIGGLRIPFDELGYECVFSSEIDRYCRQTYFENFNEIPSGDITTYPIHSIPEFDLLLGGIPCQPYSISGKKLGLEDVRGQVVYHFFNILRDHKPRYFLFENVKGLMIHNQGKTLDFIKNEFNNLGYDLSTHLLNSSDFGVPQKRERVYILGFRKDLLVDTSKIEFLPTNPHRSIWEILEKVVPNYYTISDKLWEGLKTRRERNRSLGKGFGYSLITKGDRLTRTLTSRYGKDGSEILIDQSDLGLNPRRLTPRECLRLQGFPDSYRLPVSDTQAYKQAGNSVSVPVIRELSKIFKDIESKYP